MRNFYNDYSNNTVTLMDGDTGLEVGAELTSAEKPNKNLGDFVNKKKEKPSKWKYTSRVDELAKADKITDDRDIQDKEFGEAWNDGNKMIKYIDKYGDHPKKISDQIKKDRHPLLPTTDTVKQLENLKSWANDRTKPLPHKIPKKKDLWKDVIYADMSPVERAQWNTRKFREKQERRKEDPEYKKTLQTIPGEINKVIKKEIDEISKATDLMEKVQNIHNTEYRPIRKQERSGLHGNYLQDKLVERQILKEIDDEKI